ncbi:MAG: hypothetical protein DRR08_09180 [Candidatus Parabeggiatoa sp. nov. 2]|nr:MAG: hypothetical protein B6247_26735 [Beggiatoa sp. 4572_84]RKZ61277.1 MAG: hypothetical protein DRR08_09180 [Gammaproteobacteria bacterium]
MNRPTKRERLPTMNRPTKRERSPTMNRPTKRERLPTMNRPTKRERLPTMNRPTKRERSPTTNLPTKGDQLFLASFSTTETNVWQGIQTNVWQESKLTFGSIKLKRLPVNRTLTKYSFPNRVWEFIQGRGANNFC